MKKRHENELEEERLLLQREMDGKDRELKAMRDLEI
jgi:hypothetical protein